VGDRPWRGGAQTSASCVKSRHLVVHPLDPRLVGHGFCWGVTWFLPIPEQGGMFRESQRRLLARGTGLLHNRRMIRKRPGYLWGFSAKIVAWVRNFQISVNALINSRNEIRAE